MSTIIHEKLAVDSVLVSHDVVADSCLASKVLFLGRMKLYSAFNALRVFHLKSDRVPSTIALRDSTVEVDDSKSVQNWYEFALRKGWYTSVEETFPAKYAHDDFDEHVIDKVVAEKLAALTGTVDALDALYHTDVAFQEALASGGDIYNAILTETQDRIAADSLEVTARDAAVLVETQARTLADSQEVTARDAAILVETSARILADSQEVTARDAAI